MMISAFDPRFDAFLEGVEEDIRADAARAQAETRRAKAIKEGRRGDQRHIPMIEHLIRAGLI